VEGASESYKIMFLGTSYSFVHTVCCRMYRLSWMHSVTGRRTDRQTDRQTDDIIMSLADRILKLKS